MSSATQFANYSFLLNVFFLNHGANINCTAHHICTRAVKMAEKLHSNFVLKYISSMQKRMLFAGFTAVKKTIIQNWFTPHMCREAYWIRSLLQIVSCECTTARVGGARPSTIEAWQSFLLNIRNYLKEWLLCSCCPSLSPPLLIEPWDVEYVSAVLFCFILDILLCCVWKNKK